MKESSLGGKAEMGREERQALHGQAYVDRFERQPISRIALLVPLMELSGTEKIIDIGCGNALALAALGGSFGTYTGIDFSAPFIEAARARALALGVENAAFFCGSAEAHAEKNTARYDVALVLDISEHVYDKEWLLILQSVLRMLKTNGRLFLHTPNSAFLVEIMKEKNIILKQFPEHIRVRSMEQNIGLLRQAGFDIAASRVLPHYNFLRVMHPLSRLPVIGQYFAARLFIEAIKPA